MTPRLSSQNGVSSSGVRLLEKAEACGLRVTPTSCGPREYLRRRKLYMAWLRGKRT